MAEGRNLVRLAVPLAIMHLGSMMLGVVDTAILGHWDAAALAGSGIATSVLNTVVMVATGTIMGLETLISQAVGASETERARGFLARGRVLALLLAVPTLAGVAAIPWVMRVMEVDARACAIAGPYVLARLPGILPLLWFAADRSYLQAVGKTRPLLVAIIVANVANAGLDFALVFGVPALGIPSLGALGAGIATSSVSVLMAVVSALGVRAAYPDPVVPPADVRIWPIVKLGLPLGLQISAEFGLFAVTSLLMGRLGTAIGSAHMVAISIAGNSYAVMLGVGGAASVLVGRAIGAGEPHTAQRVGRLAMAGGVTIMVGTGIFYLVFAAPLARLFTGFPDVLQATIPLLHIAAAFQISDAIQAIAGGALRGLGENRFAFLANIAGHYLIGLPIGLGLAFGLGQGAVGLWWGLTAGLTAVAIALILRFERRVLSTRRFAA